MAEYLKVEREVISQNMRRAAAPARVQRPPQVASAIPPNEKLLIACLLISPEARSAIKHYLSSANVLHLFELRGIFETALTLDAEGVSFSLESLSSRLEPRLQRIVTELSFSNLDVSETNAAQHALDCLRALEVKSLQAECEILRRRIREFEQNGNFPEALRLAAELDRMKRASSGS